MKVEVEEIKIKEILKGLKDTSLATIGGSDVVSVSQFSKETIDGIFQLAKALRSADPDSYRKLLRNKTMSALFFEPSTRTSASFIAAMSKLGGNVIPITQGVQFSSVSKGENLEDTIKTLECYSDVIVLRHPEIGSADIAANVADIPVINAGDGAGQHPTQGLLDLFTIFDEMDHSKEHITISIIGDLRFGRTVHSLVKLICLYGLKVKLLLVSPEVLRLPAKLLDELKNHNVPYGETSFLNLTEPDIFYMTRVQQERFTEIAEYERNKDVYQINLDSLGHMKKDAIIMHPLPRVYEISPEVDSDPRAAYFRQAKNGLWIRMALLAAIL